MGQIFIIDKLEKENAYPGNIANRIDPGFTERDFYQFIVNPLGTKQDNLAARIDRAGVAEKEGLDWTAKTSIKEDRWVVEMAIPWPLLTHQPPREGDIWGFKGSAWVIS